MGNCENYHILLGIPRLHFLGRMKFIFNGKEQNICEFLLLVDSFSYLFLSPATLLINNFKLIIFNISMDEKAHSTSV